MSRFLQQENYKYFYIDRKFGSGNLTELVDALDQIDTFIPFIKKIDLINSMVMRMLQLLQSFRHFFIKDQIRRIFYHHSRILMSIQSKDKIIQTLHRCFRGSDEYTRIITMQIIAALPELFLKDIAIYHNLLAKISKKNAFSIQQKKQAVICLNKLLNSSKNLSKIFCKNIEVIYQMYQIPLHILIFLLKETQIDYWLYLNIVTIIYKIFNSSLRPNTKGNRRKQKKQFQKLIVIFSKINYKVIEFYQKYLVRLLPNLVLVINNIKDVNYPFLKSKICINSQKDCQLNIKHVNELIDFLYMQKKIKRNVQQHQQLISKFMQDFQVNQNSITQLLILYFLSPRSEKIDSQILKQLQSNNLICEQKTAKILIYVECLTSALFLVQNLPRLCQKNYIVICSYLQFLITQSTQKLLQFIQITRLVESSITIIAQCWLQLQEILSLVSSNAMISFPMDKNNSIIQKIKKSNFSSSFFLQFQDQFQIISIITTQLKKISEKDILNLKKFLQNIKSKCYNLLPESALQSDIFWFARFSKPAIFHLFREDSFF